MDHLKQAVHTKIDFIDTISSRPAEYWAQCPVLVPPSLRKNMTDATDATPKQ